MQAVYLESYIHNRSESAGLHGLREQLTEAKEGSLALRRMERKVHVTEDALSVFQTIAKLSIMA